MKKSFAKFQGIGLAITVSDLGADLAPSFVCQVR